MNVREHYDLLIDEGNDPVHDPEPLRSYMDKWDGDAFLSLLELSPKKFALEIGIGTGRLAIRTAPKLRHLTGIDLSPHTIKRAAENLTQYTNIDLISGDFLSYPLMGAFDVIYSSLTLMHIEDKQYFIEKAAQLLSPGGILVLSLDKSRDTYIDYGTRKLRVYPDDPANILALMKRCGLMPQDMVQTEFAWLVKAIRP